MKKIISILLAIIVAASMCSCGAGNRPAETAVETVPVAENTEAPAIQVEVPAIQADPVAETEPEEPEPKSWYPEGLDPDKLYMLEEKNVLKRVTDRANHDMYTHRAFDIVTEYSYNLLGEASGEEKHVEYNITTVSDVLEDYQECIDHPAEYEIKYENYPDGSVKTADGKFIYTNMPLSFEFYPDGSVKSYARSNMLMNDGFHYDVSEFSEEGVLLRQYERIGDSVVNTDTYYEYGTDGQCVRETEQDYNYRLRSDLDRDKPETTTVKEYNANGYITHQTVTGLDGSITEDRYEYDGNDNCVYAYHREDDDSREIEMTYNGDGFETSAKVTYQDGTVKQCIFEYGEQNALTAYIEVQGDTEQRTEFSYDENGYLRKTVSFKNGKETGKCAYSVENNGYGRFMLHCRGKAIPGLEGSEVANDYDEAVGNYGLRYHRERKLVAKEDSVGYEYTESLYYDYEDVQYYVEVDKDSIKPFSIEDVYPDLPDTIGGYPLPEQDGSEHLFRVSFTDGNFYQLSIEYRIVYDCYHNMVGAVTMFGNTGYTHDSNEYGFVEKIYPSGTGNPDWYILINYSDDMRSYTYNVHDSDSEYSGSISLDDFSIKDALSERCENYKSDYSVKEYNEYGLLTHSKDNSGHEYTVNYRFTPDENGCLKTVDELYDYDLGEYAYPIWAFDDHGYMTDYMVHSKQRGHLRVKYAY